MSNLDSIEKAVRFIEDNLYNDISVEDVANEVGYSLYHFSRLFHAILGYTPYQYLLGRRLTEASQELQRCDGAERNIIDIAFKYQFKSHESFSRSFKRVLGLRPTDVREKTTFQSYIPRTKAITLEDIKHRARNDQYLNVEYIERGVILLVGMSALIREDTSLISELWSKFGEKAQRIANRIQPERWYEVSSWTYDTDFTGWFSTVAVEVTDLTDIPPDLVAKVIPPSKYARFKHKGLSRKVGLTKKYIYQTWLPKTEHRLAHPFEFEYYGPGYKGPNNEESESEIYVPIE